MIFSSVAWFSFFLAICCFGFNFREARVSYFVNLGESLCFFFWCWRGFVGEGSLHVVLC